MKKLFLAGILVLLSGCQMSQQTEKREVLSNLGYFKDTRTNLCFAAISSYSYGGYVVTSIAAVPCTPEVEKLVGQ